MKFKSQLNGAWEERGVFGTRIEIDAPHITVLWRSAPVLVTKFSTEECEDGVRLILKKRGLRYEGSYSDYAEMSDIVYKDGRLHIKEYFPITGDSTDILDRTENSRYGDYTVADHILGELEGEWAEPEGYFTLVFKKNTLSINDRKIDICVLEPNWNRGVYKIANLDPAKREVGEFAQMDYCCGRLSALIHICDASPMVFEFTKK